MQVTVCSSFVVKIAWLASQSLLPPSEDTLPPKCSGGRQRWLTGPGRSLAERSPPTSSTRLGATTSRPQTPASPPPFVTAANRAAALGLSRQSAAAGT